MKNITPISRRQFVRQLAGGVTATFATFLILPSALTYERIWRYVRSGPPVAEAIDSRAFLDLLVQEIPVYDELIMRDIRPTDGWVTLLQHEYPSEHGWELADEYQPSDAQA